MTEMKTDELERTADSLCDWLAERDVYLLPDADGTTFLVGPVHLPDGDPRRHPNVAVPLYANGRSALMPRRG